jgi:transcriptional regulator with XRE-family HTH domain
MGQLKQKDLLSMPRGGRRLRTEQGKMNGVGSRIKERRHQLGLEQDELCARIASLTNGGWNPAWQDMSRIENGVRTVTDLEVIAFAEALECSPCWLLMGELSKG